MQTAISEMTQQVEEFASVHPSRILVTVSQLCQRNPAFTEGGIRWWLFHRESNGLGQAVTRCGRRLYIDEGKFFDWLDGQNESGK